MEHPGWPLNIPSRHVAILWCAALPAAERHPKIERLVDCRLQPFFEVPYCSVSQNTRSGYLKAGPMVQREANWKPCGFARIQTTNSGCLFQRIPFWRLVEDQTRTGVPLGIFFRIFLFKGFLFGGLFQTKKKAANPKEGTGVSFAPGEAPAAPAPAGAQPCGAQAALGISDRVACHSAVPFGFFP